jgi:hypothetical protein
MDRARLLSVSLILLLATQVAGCELAAGIFKAGVWVGVIMVVLVVGLIAWLVTRVKS